jgi:outer membrane protein assembly factor BamA
MKISTPRKKLLKALFMKIVDVRSQAGGQTLSPHKAFLFYFVNAGQKYTVVSLRYCANCCGVQRKVKKNTRCGRTDWQVMR